MKRLFMATNPGCIENIEDAWYAVEPEPEFTDGEKLLGFNFGMCRFEKPVPGQEYQVFIVNDDNKLENPLEGLVIGKDDFLLFHERTKNESIQCRFLPARKKPSSHDPDASKSDFAKVLEALPKMTTESFPEFLEEIFESKKREIDLFLCHLLDEGQWPDLPEALSSLKDEYEALRNEPTPEGLKPFIQKCIVISSQP